MILEQHVQTAGHCHARGVWREGRQLNLDILKMRIVVQDFERGMNEVTEIVYEVGLLAPTAKLADRNSFGSCSELAKSI